MAGRRRGKIPAGQSKPVPAAEAGSLQEEIVMLRTFMRLIENMVDEGKPLGELLRMLDTLGRSSTRLAGLLRAQRELSEDKGFGTVFNQAISEVIQELEGDKSGLG
jgi:hypothetical protein